MIDSVGTFLLPMSLQRLDDGRYIALNRYYKPVGTLSRERVEYEVHPGAFRFKRVLTEQDARTLSFDGNTNLEQIFLYDESSNPHGSVENWLAYGRRLDYLMNLSLERGG